MRVLAARGARDAAGLCAVQLGRLRLDRGLPEAALAAFSEAREVTLSAAVRVDAAVGTGAARMLQARFEDAEGAFRGAVVAARDAQEATLQARAAAGLADCLLRQARIDEAETALVDTGATCDSAALAALEIVRTRVSLHRGDIREATAAARRAQAHAQVAADPRSTAGAWEAAARAAAATGDSGAALRALERGVHAAREAHLSLAAVRLHVARVELLPVEPRSLPRTRVLPPLLRADLEAATRSRARATSPADERQNELEALLLIAQGAEDDARAVALVCQAVLERAGARTVLVMGRAPETRHLAVSGKPWPGDVASALRVLAGETRVGADPAIEPCQAAEPVRYVGELIGAIACRFTAGSPVNSRRTGDVLRAAALAIAPAVRGLLDRNLPQAAPNVTGDLHGESPATRALREAIVHAARAPFPVLIEGESGSGKELVARAIHRLGARRDRRFCAVNCAALSDELLEAELFGHARGAFTGAVGERAGLFEDADGGTLFLDEVGELSPRAQAKLLRVLQDGEVRRVGENVARRVDVRIVAATNRRLEVETAAGRFRADLRFRLDVIRLEVPPLRERVEDVPLLAARFWTEAASRVGTQATLPPETLSALARYDWPGNVRELQNVVAWMAVHSPRRGRVSPSALPAHVARAAVPAATTFEAAREEFERRFVRAALASANGRRGRAAEALGVTRQGLAKMLRRLHIDPP
jgi:DNA-binding NtrC family response regulator/tetratricopeptide (TPR) repeat protein